MRTVTFATIRFFTLLLALTPVEVNATVSHLAPVKSEAWRDELSDVSKQSPIIRAVEALESRRLLDGHGLTATYYNGTTPPDPISGSPSIVSVTRVDPTVNFYWGSAAPAAGITVDKFSARWVGQVEARYSETYTFSTRTDEGVRLWIDGKLIVDAWARHRLQTDSGSITLQAGKRYDVRMEYYDFSGTAVARLMWQSASQPLEDVPTSQLYAQAPFSTPAAQPGTRIEAENFDQGAPGVAYADSDAGNMGKAYRMTDVDLQASKDTGGGYNIGWSRAGEWLEYTVDVPTAGTYSLDLRLSGMGAGGAFHVNVDGVNATGSLAVPNTANWQIWTTLTASNINMTAGRHVLRISQDTAGSSGYVSNLNWLMLRQSARQAVAVSVGGVPISNGQVLPVEFGIYQRGTTGPTLTFQVTNSTAGALSLSGLSTPSGFSVIEGLSSVLAAGASDTFTVRLDTAIEGRKTGVVQFSTSDPTASSFAFRIGGTITAPHMKVKRGGNVVNLGDAVNFGTATVGSTGPSIVFTVLNEGTATMTLGAPNLPGGFTLTEGLPSTLAPGASDTFTVTLDTTTVGFCSGSISVASNDVDVNPFVFAMTGVVSMATQPSNVLVPGTGWSGPTAQPPAVGNTSLGGYDAKTIARWDVVPYQTFKGLFNVGVVAFHMNGIDRVEFSVNGGEWTAVRAMTRNPQTDVYEYWATLNSAAFAADGAVEIRAIAYPTVGVPRVLAGPVTSNGSESLVLYSNDRGSLSQQALWVSTQGNDANGNGSQQSPYATLLKATQVAQPGAMIYVQPGTYQFSSPSIGANSNDRWITITAAPGVSRESVIIQPNQRSLAVMRLAVSNVTIDSIAGYDFFGWSPTFWTDSELWIDNCFITSSLGMAHAEIGAVIDGGWKAAYLTNSTIQDYPGRGVATPNVKLVRNSQIKNIGDDGIDNPQLVLNTHIDTIVSNAPGNHIDAIQYYPDHSDMNSIVFNVKATNVDGQLLFGGMLAADQGGEPGGIFSNVAIVNYLGTSLHGPLAIPTASGLDFGDHLLLVNVTLPNQNYNFNDRLGGTYKNTVMRGCIMWRVYGVPFGQVIEKSHIIDFVHEQSALPVGDYTTGDPGFTALPQLDGTYLPTGDFQLTALSPLRTRLLTPFVPVNIDNSVRSAPGSIGAY